MLEQFLGPDVFRAGVRDYLRAHAYANADTVDLWRALGRASGLAVDVLMDAWIFRPGFPLVTVRRDGPELVVAQQRFTYLPEPPGFAGAVTDGDTRWHVPIQLRVESPGGATTHRLLLTDREIRLPLPRDAGAVLVNEGGPGFYRVRYAPELLAALLARLPGHLAPIERFNLVGDAWATTLAGLGPVTAYLELATRFHAERDRNVWTVLLGSLGMLNRVIAPADRPRLEAFARDLVAPAVADLGWEPRAGEDELTRQLRGDLIRALGTLGNDRPIQAKAAERYAAFLADPASLDPNLLPALITVLAHAGDAARYAEFLNRFRTATTPQEEQRYLYALAAFRSRESIEQTLERAVNGEIRTQDAPFVVRSLLMNVAAREQAWAFVKDRWETMDRLYPKQGLRRMCEGVTALATPALERDVHAFFAERRPDFGGKVLEQYLEQLRIAVALAERENPVLRPYLATFV
jgi:puromycin-sensitive aminopeptidase